jgi:diadenosine tetraphosphate (Ap4A) HIT family hydrolase
MKKSKVRYDNARHPEQVKRMELLEKEVGCFFCADNYLKVGASPSIHNREHWYIKKSDYPYAGSVHHYLIASKRHVTDITKISAAAWKEFPSMLSWLKKRLKTKGEGIFVRSGDMRYTGATLDHIHFHFISGAPKKKNFDLSDNILVTLGHKKK